MKKKEEKQQPKNKFISTNPARTHVPLIQFSPFWPYLFILFIFLLVCVMCVYFFFKRIPLWPLNHFARTEPILMGITSCNNLRYICTIQQGLAHWPIGATVFFCTARIYQTKWTNEPHRIAPHMKIVPIIHEIKYKTPHHNKILSLIYGECIVSNFCQK